MIKKKMEHILAEELKGKFEKSRIFDRIYISKRPYQATSLRKKWYDIFGKPLNVSSKLTPPLQPEIDLILCDDIKHKMIAVELKYFRKKGKGLDHSFYEGIEQSLALLRWGFDYVALWQLFDARINKDELLFYGAGTWNFLHKEPKDGGLALPLDYTMMQVRKKGDGYDFIPFRRQKKNNKWNLEPLQPPYDPGFTFVAHHQNSLLNNSNDVLIHRRMLDEWLNNQKP